MIEVSAYAPPELSEPAITRMRFIAIADTVVMIRVPLFSNVSCLPSRGFRQKLSAITSYPAEQKLDGRTVKGTMATLAPASEDCLTSTVTLIVNDASYSVALRCMRLVEVCKICAARHFNIHQTQSAVQ